MPFWHNLELQTERQREPACLETYFCKLNVLLKTYKEEIVLKFAWRIAADEGLLLLLLFLKEKYKAILEMIV